ncbi:MAG TPA: Ig-like domain-containing protein [Gemmatimonadaceae bacterium]|nr:Ig-like domain-containing protein [Gemmatimonadaceae bacterium]
MVRRGTPRRALAGFAMWAAAALAAAAVAACGDSPTGNGRAGPPAAVRIISGNEQQGVVGARLAAPLVVRVEDAEGRPVRGQVLAFRVIEGGGSVFAGAAATDEDGRAQEIWTLGTSTADSQKVEARAVDSRTGEPIVFATFRATARADVPARVEVAAGSGQGAVVTAALPDSLTVRVFDRFDNPVPGATVTWRVVTGGGTVGRASSVTNDSGFARTSWTLGTAAGPQSVAAAAGSLEATFTASASAAAPARLVVTAGGGDGASAQVFSRPTVSPAVRVEDAHGNPVPGIGVRFAVAEGGGTIAGAGTSHTVLTGPDGVAAEGGWTLGTRAGTNRLSAEVTGLTPVVFAVTGVPGPAAILKTSAGDEQTGTVGAAVAVPPTVLVTDAWSNPLSGVPVAFAVTFGGGTIQSASATTDAAGLASAGIWTLGPFEGTNTVVASASGLGPVTFTASTLRTASGIGATLLSPRNPLSLVGDDLGLLVSVSSSRQVLSVRATVRDRQATLQPQTTTLYGGTLSLAGVPRGEMDLVVTVTDVTGAVADRALRIIHDVRPTLTIAAPVDGAVARPTLPVDVSCTDDDPIGCDLTVAAVVGSSETVLASGRNRITTTLDLSAYEGKDLELLVRARDSNNQQTTRSLIVYVESSAALTLRATVGGPILDVLGSRVLYIDRSGAVARARVRDLSTGADEALAGGPAGDARYGYLTAGGVLLAAQSTPGSYELYEWRGGPAIDLGPLNSSLSLVVRGQYAVYSNGPLLMRRDVTAGATTLVANNAGNLENDVSAAGDVAYWTSDYQVYRRAADGTTTHLTADSPAAQNIYPRTDGARVVFLRQTACCTSPQQQIVLHDGQSEVVLAPPTARTLAPDRDYRIENGWVAFTRAASATDVHYLWVRSPSGEERQIPSSFGTSWIDALAPDGTVVFSVGATRYRVRPGGSAEAVGAALGQVLWRDGRFVALIGASMFEFP